jgi:RNA polymerase sigma-70 factor (ECF subfamily)
MTTAMDESPKRRPEPGEVETQGLIDRAVRGDQEAWGELLARYRDRLRRMVALRLDRRLQGRVDASDVIQDAMLEASGRLAEYRQNPTMPFFLWLRYITGQRLLEQHRRHLGAQGRDAGREISLYRGAMPETTTAALAAQLLGRYTSPSQAAQRAERKIRLQESLNSLEPLDREILALRHFEHLSNGEAAEVLGLDKSAASKRYARALIRLKDVLASRPGGLGEL